MGVVVGGVILDESVLLASNSPQHENSSLQPVADSLLRKLRHSKIPSVFLSLSLLQLHCSLPNILLQPFWVFFDLRCTNFFYGQLLNLYVFITTNFVLGIFYFVNQMLLIILMN